MAATMSDTKAHMSMPPAEFLASPLRVYASSMASLISFIWAFNMSPLMPKPSIISLVLSNVISARTPGNSGAMT